MRVYPVKQEELWANGLVEQAYRGSKWGKYFRAPAVYFKLLERAKARLCPLGQVTKVHFGLKTGCKEFFYLKGSQLEAIEQEYLLPVVKSPREVQGVTIKSDQLKYSLLAVAQEPSALQGKRVWEYITWGEQQGFHLRPSTKGRVWWYSIARNQGPGLLFRRFFYDRFNLPVISEQLTEDQTFYRVVYAGDPQVLGAIMNSTIMAPFIEMSGRMALGEGVLQFAVYEASQVLIVNPERLTGELVVKLKQAFVRLSARATEAIFREVQQQDRQALDLLILQSLGFDNEEAQIVLAEVYQAVINLVSQRLARAHTILN